MKKKNILSLTVLSSLMAIAGFSSFNRVSADSVGVHAAETTSTTMPTGWNASGVTADNTISPFKDSVQGNSILLKRTVAEGVLMARSSLTTVKPNTYYNFSVNAKTTGASQLKIRVIEYKDGISPLKATEVIKVTTVTGDWVSRPGMLKTTAETHGIVIEIEATGTGEVYASKLFVHEGVAPTGVMTGRTKYFQSPADKPEENIYKLQGITADLLSNDAATGYSSMKLIPGRGVRFNFDDNKITGKFTLRFKYKYVSVSGGTTGTRLAIRLDYVNDAGDKAYYASEPSSGGTRHNMWDTYSFEFRAKPGTDPEHCAEPEFVTIYAALQDSTKNSDSYYLLDDIEVIDEKGNNLVENGDFELKEAATVNTMGYASIPDGSNEVAWYGNFGAIPSSAYIYDGFNGSKAIHLDSKKSLGIALPLLPNDDANKIFTLSFKYRTNQAPLHWLRMDGFYTNNDCMYYATAGSSLENTNGNWSTASYEFKTKNNAESNNATSTEFMIFNAGTPIDLDDISIKDPAGNEYVYGGNFETLLGGGLSYKNNAGAYVDENGNVVYSTLKYLTSSATATESCLRINPYSLGLDVANVNSTYTLSYEYFGGVDWGCASASDTLTWIHGTQVRALEWKSVGEKTFKIEHSSGATKQELLIYGNNYWNADPNSKDSKNCYIRNISVKDADGNEYFHPLSNGASILPQGSFLINDKEAVDEFVAAYITGEAAEDYTAIPEADRAGKCQNKLTKAEGALRRMTTSQQEFFRTSDDYIAARAAMNMWRTVSSKTSIGIFGGNAASNSTTILVCTLLAISAVAITSFALIRKKRHN